MTRLNQAVRIQDAAQSAPALSELMVRAGESQKMLASVQALIPLGLRQQVLAGPWDAGQWCLLVGSNAAAAKLRQLLPALQATLVQQGRQVSSIRIKIQATQR